MKRLGPAPPRPAPPHSPCRHPDRPSARPGGIGGIGGAAVLLAAAMLLVASCKPEQTAPPPPVVQVATVTGTNVPTHTEFIGQLDSPQNVQVRARVEAFVQKVHFAEGLPVQENHPLFTLDAKPYEEQLAAALGMLAEAEAALKKYEADVARLVPLAEKRAVPQQDLDNARAAVDGGRASVLSAQARVDAARLDIGYCDVRAPITGLIGAKQVSVGELVGKGEPTLLATISTLDPIWFYCAISEVQYLQAEARIRSTGRDLSSVPITLILADGTSHPARGKFIFIDRAVDVKTGTLRVRAEFANPDGLLRPGMFARIRVDLGVRPDTLLLPERALTELQGKYFVWIVDAENKASQRAVKLGENLGGQVVIQEGLQAGDRIILEGHQKVKEGQPVQAMTADQIAQAEAARQAGTPSAKE